GGFPRSYPLCQPDGICRTDRYRGPGWSFQDRFQLGPPLHQSTDHPTTCGDRRYAQQPTPGYSTPERMREDFTVMTAWFVILVPLVIMFFTLFMERVEARLLHVAVQENEVEELLENARPDEVRALFRQGIGRALELFRLRRVGRAGRLRTR